MKPKLNPPQVCKPVRYQWTSNGVTCHGHTVVLAGTRAALRRAERHFWKQNPHITQEAA